MARRGIELSSQDRETIRIHRIVARMTQEQLGASIGRSRRWIGRIESAGPAIMKLKDLIGLAAALGVDRGGLVRRE